MAESKIAIEITKDELYLIVFSLSSSQPPSVSHEAIQFSLYHRLLAKLNSLVNP